MATAMTKKRPTAKSQKLPMDFPGYTEMGRHDGLATKSDIINLERDMGKMRGEIGEIRGKIDSVRNELKGEIREVRDEIKAVNNKIDGVKSELNGKIQIIIFQPPAPFWLSSALL